jgi:hypothetical protein
MTAHLLACLIVALGVLVGSVGVLPTSAYAQDSSQETFLENTAQAAFPNNITFSMTAESPNVEITEVELLYGLKRSETFTVVPITFTPGDQIQAEHVLDTRIYHLPVGVDVTYRWIMRDAAGNEWVSDTGELTYHDERFAWQQRTERSITVFWYEGSEAFGDELIQISVRALESLEREIGATVEEPVKIYIYANTRDMRSALQSNEVEWVGGQASPALGLIIASVAAGNTAEAQRIIPHELSHQVLHQTIDNPYGGIPLWFDEGLAVYNQEVADTIFPLMLEEAARTDQLIPLEALSASFPADPDRALLSYAQSHSIVAYMFDTYGTEQVKQLVGVFNEAVPVDEAIPQVLGVSVDDLDAQWRATLPPAEVSAEPMVSDPVAPADRFEGDPVVPSLNQAPAVPTSTAAAGSASASSQSPQQPTPINNSPSLLPGLGLPLWVELTLAATACISSIAVAGVVLFVTLRLTKAGQE